MNIEREHRRLQLEAMSKTLNGQERIAAIFERLRDPISFEVEPPTYPEMIEVILKQYPDGATGSIQLPAKGQAVTKQKSQSSELRFRWQKSMENFDRVLIHLNDLQKQLDLLVGAQEKTLLRFEQDLRSVNSVGQSSMRPMTL